MTTTFEKAAPVTDLFRTTALKAMALPANTAQVWPGGATFTSIQAAVNSISGASAQEQYQVAVGPGIYNERVTMVDYIYIIGAGQDISIISAQGTQYFNNGTVIASSNSGISECTIEAIGGGWGTCPVGISIVGSGNFHISGVTIKSTDSGNDGNNIRGISNNQGSYTGNVTVGETIISLTGTGNSSVGTAIEGFGDGSSNAYTYFINLCSIDVQCVAQSYGLITAVGASAVLDNSKISAATFALNDSDSASPITANQCTINGPVSSGVVVNP